MFQQQLSWYSPGTTSTYLQLVHTSAAIGASKKYNLTWDQVTAEVCQKYLREREYQAKQKDVIEREEQIVELYEDFKRRKWLFTISLFLQISHLSQRIKSE